MSMLSFHNKMMVYATLSLDLELDPKFWCIPTWPKQAVSCCSLCISLCLPSISGKWTYLTILQPRLINLILPNSSRNLYIMRANPILILKHQVSPVTFQHFMRRLPYSHSHPLSLPLMLQVISRGLAGCIANIFMSLMPGGKTLAAMIVSLSVLIWSWRKCVLWHHSCVTLVFIETWRHLLPMCPCTLVLMCRQLSWQTTRMWVVKPNINPEDRTHFASVIHLNTIFHTTHLLPVYGDELVATYLSFTQSLDVFNAYYVNKYISHHAFKIAFWFFTLDPFIKDSTLIYHHFKIFLCSQWNLVNFQHHQQGNTFLVHGGMWTDFKTHCTSRHLTNGHHSTKPN